MLLGDYHTDPVGTVNYTVSCSEKCLSFRFAWGSKFTRDELYKLPLILQVLEKETFLKRLSIFTGVKKRLLSDYEVFKGNVT
jgi:hypothetical protein